MKTFLVSTFVACLAAAAPTALWAADDHHEQGDQQRGQHSAQPAQQAPTGGVLRGQGGGRNAQPTAERASGPTGGTYRGQGNGRSAHSAQFAPSPEMGGGRTRNRVTTQQPGMFQGPTGQSAMPSHNRRATTDARFGAPTQTTQRSATRNRANVDVASYRRNFTAERRYSYGNYNAPQGYAYHRYNYGDRLPDEYFARDFWIVNYLNFGLISPPDGYVWVRYGSDAVLIDEDTGDIVQVVYNQFY
jgi:Ni/Co efflux regulator RcnB